MAIGRIPEPLAGIQESIIAAKGDLIVGTANDQAGILSVGTNGHTLVADSSTATGLKWAAPAGGDLKLISRQNVSNVAQIDFEGVFTSTYETYFLIAENVWGASSGADLQAQMMYSTNTVDSADYYGAHSRLTYQINGLNTGYNGGSSMGLALASLSTSQNDGTAVFATITGVGNRSERTLLHGHAAGYQAPLALINFAYFSTQRTYTGIRIKASTGNIYGRVAIYGLAK